VLGFVCSASQSCSRWCTDQMTVSPSVSAVEPNLYCHFTPAALKSEGDVTRKLAFSTLAPPTLSAVHKRRFICWDGNMAVCIGNTLYTVVVGRWKGAPDGMLSCNTRGCAEGHNSEMRQLDRKHLAKSSLQQCWQSSGILFSDRLAN